MQFFSAPLRARHFSTILLLSLALAPFSLAATPEQVDRAIEKARKFLYSQQKESGHWETDDARKGTGHVAKDWKAMQGDSYGGFTALATYALLASGENPEDPHIQKAVDFLEKADVVGIYGLGIRSQVWLLLPPSAKTKAMAHRDAKLILDGVISKDPKHPDYDGFWEYGNGHGEDLAKGPRHLDHSVSQYGILGLWAAARNGVEIDPAQWKLFETVWKAHQFPDGGWDYEGYPSKPDKKGETASMTAAGVASLFIMEDILHSDDGVNCRGNITNDNIEKGLKWMSDHFDKVGRNVYALYGIERIGVASGYKYFGTIDWYNQGADRLVKAQKADGSFPGGGVAQGDLPIPDTAFALLFLTRGRAPVMMNKLQYTVESDGKTTEANWDQRPRDVANAAHWTGEQMERDLNFQIVNLKVSADDLHDAPILYISGDQALKFSDDEMAKLRQYIEGGGMIFANADCGLAKPLFAKSFEEIGKRLFPKYAFRDLPANHLILTGENFPATGWKEKPRIRSMTNGVRELMLLVPEADAARAWQTHAEKTREEMFQFAADVFLYAVDKRNLRNKGETYFMKADPKIKAEQTAKVARLIVGDNPDPEPGGWRRLAALLHNKFKADVTVEDIRLGQDRLSGFKLAHLTGTSRFKLTDAQRAALAEFVIRGGTIVIDAAGGSTEFAESAETELRTIFGEAATKALGDPLDIESPVYILADAKIESVFYRDIYKQKVVGKLKTPRIFGLAQGDRIAVFYSREDLSAGIVGEPVDGINGYTPQSATELMRNITLYGAFGMRPGASASSSGSGQPAPATK
jgi:hypothetical protein